MPATPLAKTVAVVTDEARKAARFYEIEIDRFNVLRFHRVQLEFRRKSLEAKGYVLEGNRFVYRPKFDWYDDWQDDGE